MLSCVILSTYSQASDQEYRNLIMMAGPFYSNTTRKPLNTHRYAAIHKHAHTSKWPATIAVAGPLHSNTQKPPKSATSQHNHTCLHTFKHSPQSGHHHNGWAFSQHHHTEDPSTHTDMQPRMHAHTHTQTCTHLKVATVTMAGPLRSTTTRKPQNSTTCKHNHMCFHT